MIQIIKNTSNSIGKGLKFFFLDLINGRSTRIQLLYATFFCWATALFYFGIIFPFVREVSIIYYCYKGLSWPPINLSSEYATLIISTMSTAFLATVAAYIVSNKERYKTQLTSLIDKAQTERGVSETKENEDSKEDPEP